MGKCNSKRKIYEEYSEQHLRGRLTCLDSGPVTIKFANNYGAINIIAGKKQKKWLDIQESKGSKAFAFESDSCSDDDKDVEDSIKPLKTRAEVVEQQPESAQILNSACSDVENKVSSPELLKSLPNQELSNTLSKQGLTKTLANQEAPRTLSSQEHSTSDTFVYEDNHLNNEKFNSLQNEPYENDLNRTLMNNLKENQECQDSDGNCQQFAGDKSLQNDIFKNVTFTQTEIMERVGSKNDSLSLDNSKNKLTEEMKPVGSGLNFSILSEQQPCFPTDWKGGKARTKNENIEPYSERSCGSSVEETFDNVKYGIASPVLSKKPFSISFSNSVTGYPNDTRHGTSLDASSSYLSTSEDQLIKSFDFSSSADNIVSGKKFPYVTIGSSDELEIPWWSIVEFDNKSKTSEKTNKKVDSVSVACQTTLDTMVEIEYEPKQKSSPLSFLDAAKSRFPQKSGVSSFEQSLEDPVNKDCDDDLCAKEYVECGKENENETEKDKCQALSYSDSYQTHFTVDLTEAAETDDYEESEIKALEKIIQIETHVTVTLRDISFLIYVNFITLKTPVCASLNPVQILFVEIPGRYLNSVRTTDFPLQLLAVCSGEEKCMQKTVKCVISKSADSDSTSENHFTNTLGTNNKESDEVKDVFSLPSSNDSTGEHGNRYDNTEKHENAESRTKNNADMQGKWGHTYPLLENEQLAKGQIAAKEKCSKSPNEMTAELPYIPIIHNPFGKHLNSDGNCQLPCFGSLGNNRELEQVENIVISQSNTYSQNENISIGECCKEDEQHKDRSFKADPLNERKKKKSRDYSHPGDQYRLDADKKNGKVIKSGRSSVKRSTKRRVKGRLDASSPLKTLGESFSDSSLEDRDTEERNACNYCKRNLNIPNKKCKHHKKIRHPKTEIKQFEVPGLSSDISDTGIGKKFHILVESFDSGIASESAASVEQSLNYLRKTQKIINSKYSLHLKKGNNKSSLSKLNTKSYKVRKFLYQGRIPFSKFRNALRNVNAGECERQIAKEIARELHIDHRNLPVFGLGSYFDRLNNGPPPTTRERMQYEWLRLATFHNYAGNGNALALARNGFYHDQTEGPASTRCYLCNANRSNWEMFDDVNVEHRRQSPNCPFHTNSDQETLNISISSGDGDSSSVQARTSAPVSTSVNATVTTTSSSGEAAVNDVRRSLKRTEIGHDQTPSSGAESILRQPTEDPESGDHRSLLALAQPRTQRAVGRTGQSFSTIIAPRRNNVAVGARSNIGIETASSGSSTPGTPTHPQGLRTEVQTPVRTEAQTPVRTEAQTSVSTATEALQGSSAALPAPAPTSGSEQATAGLGGGGRHDPTSTVVVDNPKHPDYINIDTRIVSYQGFPDYLDQTPRQMSEAGFFFVGVADFTRCFCCGGGLRNWEPGDDPMLEHTRWFPRCEYVNKLKGERYVAAVQRRHQEHMAEQQRQQIELAERRDENRNPPDPMTTDAAAVMREMGYSVERTREAILAVRGQTGSSVVTTQQVLTWLLDEEDRRSHANAALGIRPPGSIVSSTPSSVVNTSIPSSIVYTGTSIASSIIYTGTSIGTSIVNTISSMSTATSIVNAGTTTSTVNSTSTASTAEVQQTSETGNQQTGTSQTGAMSTSSSSSGGGSVEKQSGASGGDSDESKSKTTGETTSSETSSKAAKKKSAKKKAKSKAGTKSETTGATGGGLDAKSLKAENEKLREMQTCKICMEQPVNTTLLPCGHLVCCNSCASRLQRCPICRKRIKGTVKTFMS